MPEKDESEAKPPIDEDLTDRFEALADRVHRIVRPDEDELPLKTDRDPSLPSFPDVPTTRRRISRGPGAGTWQGLQGAAQGIQLVFTFIAAPVGGFLVGWYIESKTGNSTGEIIGVVIGFALGLFLVVKGLTRGDLK